MTHLTLTSRIEATNSLSCVGQLEEFKNILESTQTRVTFWGTRVIEPLGASSFPSGIDNSISLNAFVNRMEPLQMARISNNLYDPETPKRIIRKLNEFYSQTNAQLSQGNFITRILNYIQESIFNPLPSLDRIRETLDSLSESAREKLPGDRSH